MRPSIIHWYMMQAYIVALRSTCTRRKVGAIITDVAGHILSHGYNGVATGARHCTVVPCEGQNFASNSHHDLCGAIHAEQNAVARLIGRDHASQLFVTTSPCTSCMKLLLATNIEQIWYGEEYDSQALALWINNGRKAEFVDITCDVGEPGVISLEFPINWSHEL